MLYLIQAKAVQQLREAVIDVSDMRSRGTCSTNIFEIRAVQEGGRFSLFEAIMADREGHKITNLLEGKCYT